MTGQVHPPPLSRGIGDSDQVGPNRAVAVGRRVGWAALGYLGAIAVMPLAGALAAGENPWQFLAFPPKPRPLPDPQTFSAPLFALTAALLLLGLAPFLVRIARSATPPAPEVPGRYPGFTWVGALAIGLAWGLAWSRFDWARPLQPFIFTPLWLGYIVTMNGLCQRRAGHCPMLERPRFFLALFPASALFWWSFEYLNQFVGNWQYFGRGTPGPWLDFLESSLPFSTVLPAVWSTAAYLETFPGLGRGLDRCGRPRLPSPRAFGAGAVALGLVSLAGVGAAPRQAYPLVWLAPLALATGWSLLLGLATPLATALASGDWRRPWRFALAGLLCGGFWELWNFRSLVHWEYRIPYLDAYKLFRCRSWAMRGICLSACCARQ